MVIQCPNFSRTFPLSNLKVKSNDSIEKIKLFRSTQERTLYLIPFKSYEHFPERSEIGQLTTGHSKMYLNRGIRPCWNDWWYLFSFSDWSCAKNSRLWNFILLDNEVRKTYISKVWSYWRQISLKMKINITNRFRMAEYLCLDIF